MQRGPACHISTLCDRLLTAWSHLVQRGLVPEFDCLAIASLLPKKRGGHHARACGSSCCRHCVHRQMALRLQPRELPVRCSPAIWAFHDIPRDAQCAGWPVPSGRPRNRGIDVVQDGHGPSHDDFGALCVRCALGCGPHWYAWLCSPPVAVWALLRPGCPKQGFFSDTIFVCVEVAGHIYTSILYCGTALWLGMHGSLRAQHLVCNSWLQSWKSDM